MFNCCGERGIRTPGPVTRTTVFETAPIDHSGISPLLVDPDMFWFRDDKNKKLFLLSIFSSNIQRNHFDDLKINAQYNALHLGFAGISNRGSHRAKEGVITRGIIYIIKLLFTCIKQ